MPFSFSLILINLKLSIRDTFLCYAVPMMKHTYSTFTYHYFSLSLTIIIHALIIGALFLHLIFHQSVADKRSHKNTGVPIMMRSPSSAAQPQREAISREQMPAPQVKAPAAQAPMPPQPLASSPTDVAQSVPAPPISQPMILPPRRSSMPSSSSRPTRPAASAWRKPNGSSARAALHEQRAIPHPADKYENLTQHKSTNAELAQRTKEDFKRDKLFRYIRSIMQAIADTYNQTAPILHFEYDEHQKPHFRLTVSKEGKVIDVTIIEPSHVEQFNRLIIQAVKHAQPFKPIPVSLLEGEESLTIHVTGPRFIPHGKQQLTLYLEEM